MKKFVKRVGNPLVNLLVSSKSLWAILNYFVRLANWFRYQRDQFENAKTAAELRMKFSEKIVQDGFFKGLLYPSFTSFGSSLFPKLAGTYENELFPLFEELTKENYEEIIDIGCADGYYAVGLAKKFERARVVAFDIDKEALRTCKSMAGLNGVAERMTLGEHCDAAFFDSLPPEKRRLIICDCEGYEFELFSKRNAPNLKHADLIIELHPFVHRTVKEGLVAIFQPTHNWSIVSSFDDERKIFEASRQLDGLTKIQKIKAVQEGRGLTMDWLILLSKKTREC